MATSAKREVAWWMGLGGLLAVFALSTYVLFKTLTPRSIPGNAPSIALATADILLEYARNYALSNAGAIATGVAIESNGIRIEPGARPGETKSPLPAQLSALGFARASTPGGLITIDVSPKGCAFPDCEFDVTVVAEGARRTEHIGPRVTKK